MAEHFHEAEKKVLQKLHGAWNSYTELDIFHEDEQREFRNAIHSAQCLILARGGQRALRGITIGVLDVTTKHQTPNTEHQPPSPNALS